MLTFPLLMGCEDDNKDRVKLRKIILNIERCSRLRPWHIVLSRNLGYCL